MLFVFTRAVVEADNQNDEQESDPSDPRHDGGARPSLQTVLRDKRNPDNYIPAPMVHLLFGSAEFDLS